MPAVFALATQVVGNPVVATFAAFGSFAMLLLADFGGTLTERLAAQASLVAIGCVLIAIATLVSRNPWVATVAMFVVGFLVLFAGVVSSALAAASTSILLSFILPVATPAGPDAIPDRLLGWLLAGVVSLPAVTLLWPAPRSEPLRDAAAEACRRLSARLTAEAADWHGEDTGDVDEPVARANAAVAELRATFLATPYQPSGLTMATRAIVRLVDEVVWLSVILDNSAATRHRPRADPTVRKVKTAAAVLLDHAGKALSLREPPQDSLQDHLDDFARARREMEAMAIADVELPGDGRTAEDLVSSMTPSFRAQELSFAVMAIADNVASATAAEQRAWWQKLLGRQPRGLAGPIASAQERALAHIEPHSVWLRNSLRGGIALGGAVLVADLSGAEHSFWIVLGALSVLRSNALSTGQSVVRGLVGTTIGFVVGGALVLVLGTNPVLLWVLLPVAIMVAGIAPAVSFTAGQAGFTVALVILFNIIGPAGWQVGLVRIEDVAIGCAVSLVVGALFWPRGAAGALRRALAEAYADCAAYLRTAAESGAAVDGSAEEVGTARLRAAAAAHRLDDAFREYLTERGNKRLSLAQVASLLTGVAGLRLTAEAVSDLWAGAGSARIDTPRAQLELIVTTERVTNWFAAMAQAMTGAGTVPRAFPQDGPSAIRLVEALSQDLESASAPDASVKAQTVRLGWTSDHMDAARRLQDLVEQPARAAAD
ncbi:FUSC family protein [Pseudonocardia aurantiaca]|uniref:FUSC family protein n=1 Tax=Pseudonocardia aurantiaca TaxID=75290 RepID=A0ABW4FZ39_9PSEU